MNSDPQRAWDVAYEWKIVTLLSLGFGLVGVDRFMIMPLFPVLMADLRLDYQDLGHITGRSPSRGVCRPCSREGLPTGSATGKS
ncbi:hypothetical protein VOM14_08740 [Paraburkholderia sp. MPAMCS5]|uniref:hypothetical protein n=1 Tax=Paraburkholderia sp. MPAMCS5 TaxID=3112563 RepID=UPI002E197D7E|nr:hypothetical protein [Paraburkholderia sp. MPAMCS5]